MSNMIDSLRNLRKRFDNLAKLCRATRQNEPPSWKVTTDSLRKKCGTGFLGSIPSGKALLLQGGSLNLVSTRWRDWKDFPIQQVETTIFLPSGEAVPCLGLISGSWTFEEDADLRWDGVEVFVVDVTIKDESDQIFNFVLSETCVRPERARACELVVTLSEHHFSLTRMFHSD